MTASSNLAQQATVFTGADDRALEHSNADKSFYFQGQWWAVLPDGSNWSVHRYSPPDTATETPGAWTQAGVSLLNTKARADIAFDAVHERLWVLNFGPSTPDPHLYELKYRGGSWVIDEDISLAASGLTGAEWVNNNEIVLGLDQAGRPLLAAIGSDGLHVASADPSLGAKEGNPWIETLLDPDTTRGAGNSSSHSKADFVTYTDQDGHDAIAIAYGRDDIDGPDSWQFAFHASGGDSVDYAGGWAQQTIATAKQVSVDNHISTVADGSTIYVVMKDNNNAIWLVRGTPGHWEAPIEVTHGTALDGPSRPSLVLDDTHHELYVFYQDSTRHPDDIYYKKTSTEALSFDPADLGTAIVSGEGVTFGNPQLPAQHVGDATGGEFFVFADGSGQKVWYSAINLNPVPPPEDPPVDPPVDPPADPPADPPVDPGQGPTDPGPGSGPTEGPGTVADVPTNQPPVVGTQTPVVTTPPAQPVEPFLPVTTIGTAGNDRIHGQAIADVIEGRAGNDTITGGAGDDRLYGMKGHDRLLGGLGHDHLVGGAGADILDGGAGDDLLFGGAGPDVLYGRAGKDAFVFDTRPNGAHDVDTIKDFKVRDDSVWLAGSTFKAIGHAGSPESPAHLKAAFFWKGAAAHDSNDHVIYDPTSGALSYDPDGTGPAAQVRIAQLATHLKITAKDFFVV